MVPEQFLGTGKASTLKTGNSRRAYVTFSAGNGDYVKGVVGLAKGLRKVKSSYPSLVAILPDVPEEHREILRSQGCIVLEIDPIYPPENHVQFAMAYYVTNYSKLRIWNFVEFSKMISLDADIFDTQNGHFYAVMYCFCEKTRSHSPQYKIGYCQQCPNKDFLNMFFQNMYKPIPLIYNLVLAMLWRHPENVELENVKVVHYCAAESDSSPSCWRQLGPKPWRYTGKEVNMDREDIKMLVPKWWDVYNDESLDLKAENLIPAVKENSRGHQLCQLFLSPEVFHSCSLCCLKNVILRSTT